MPVTANPSLAAGRPTQGSSGRSCAELVPLAAIGVVLGHLLTYAIAIPDARERSGFLARTGHGYFPVFAEYALVVGTITLAAWLIGSLRPDGRVAGARGVVGVLAPVQVVGFVCLEVGERAIGHASFADLVGRDLIIGVLVQVLVAAVVAWIVAVVTRAAAHCLAAASGRPPRYATVSVRPPVVARPASKAVAAMLGARAPPILSLGT
jgi:hypothetical protein